MKNDKENVLVSYNFERDCFDFTGKKTGNSCSL